MGACARNMQIDPAEIKPAQCCIKLVFHLTYTMMHGNTKLKFCDAKQARNIYNYKNIKRKLYRTNTAILYNKICRQKQLTPSYINIRIKVKNKQSRNTLRTANLYRINQEIIFLYAKKSKLNGVSFLIWRSEDPPANITICTGGCRVSILNS